MDVQLLQDIEGGSSLLNGVLNSYADLSKSNYVANQFKFNEQIADIQSKEALAQGAVEEKVSQQRTAQIGGAQKAAEAASGVDVHSGTSVTNREQTGEIGGLDVATIANNAAMKALGFQIQGQNDSTQAALTGLEGKVKSSNDLFQGGEQLFQSQLKAIDYKNYPPVAGTYDSPTAEQLDSTQAAP